MASPELVLGICKTIAAASNRISDLEISAAFQTKKTWEIIKTLSWMREAGIVAPVKKQRSILYGLTRCGAEMVGSSTHFVSTFKPTVPFEVVMNEGSAEAWCPSTGLRIPLRSVEDERMAKERARSWGLLVL